MEPVSYDACRYDGGLKDLRASTNATVTIDDDHFTVRYPAADAHSPDEIVRLWNGWGAVQKVNIAPIEDGTRLTVTILNRGSSVIELPRVRTIELWRSLYLVTKFRDRVPTDLIADRFRFVNYEGPLSVDPNGRSTGTIAFLGDEDKWRLKFDDSTKSTSGGVTRYPAEVEPNGPAACRVTMRDAKDATDWGRFDLPNTAAPELERALAERTAFRSRLLATASPEAPTPAKPVASVQAAPPAAEPSPAAKKKATEYRIVNYDGAFKSVPEAGLSGTIEVKPDGMWHLHLGFRKHVNGYFSDFPFQVEPISEQSCRVTARHVDRASHAVRFELPDTPAAVLLADLNERGYALERMMAGGEQRRQRKAAGEWWAGIKPGRLLIGCHYSGARNKGESGELTATADGLHYKALLGSKVSIPWQAIRDIEVSTQSTKRVTAGRAVALGVFALAAKKGETFTYVHVSDANSIWSFASKSSQGSVLTAMKPVLDAFNSRVAPARRAAASPSPQTSSTADELAKLAKLRDSGVLTETEFATQKAKLLS